MSGPGLNQRDAHHVIHQAAFYEAERLTLLLRRSLRTGDEQRALQVATVLIEHWQTHTLRHAEAEETGWYREILAAQPELQADVIALTRDHELLRTLLAEVQRILSARGIASGVVERFEAMLLLNSIHSREEERRLFGGEPLVVASRDADSTHSAAQPDEPPGTTADAAGQGDTARRASFKAPVPLAVARPALHAQLVGLLRQRGLSPADVMAELQTDSAGQAVLHVAYGRDYTQTMDWPLVDGAPAEIGAAHDATEAMLCQVSDVCEQATQADYHARMHTPT